jgi:hypothetical protein
LSSAVLAGYALVMLGALVPGGTQVKCNQQCDAGYSADEDDCRYQYGTPADTDALAHCIREAREDYRNCLDDCASATISLPGRRIVVAAAPTTAARSLLPQACAQLSTRVGP